jgi:hypothetical protein
LTHEGRCLTDELWPRQPRPGTIHRRVWKRFLKDISNDNRSLLKPLQHWTRRTATNWSAYYDTSQHQAVTSEDQISWFKWKLEPTRRGWAMTGKTPVEPPQRSMSFVPANVDTVRGQPALRWHESELATGPRTVATAQALEEPTTWATLSRQLPRWERKLIGD